MTNMLARIRDWLEGRDAVKATPGKLTVGSDGRLHGDAQLRFNSPFPCVNGSFGSGKMLGVLMHTMVGDLPGTIAVFNERGFDASAQFGISQSGEIWQFGPVGKGWIAWHAMAANDTYYGIEHADAGDPDHPLTDAQLTASAQVVECLSAFAGFPLQEANAPGERGYGTHNMGGAAYGGHSCPDLPPKHVRSAQRPEILRRAKAIRAGHHTPKPTAPATLLEDPMLLNRGAGAITPVALPSSCTKVRFFTAAGVASIEWQLVGEVSHPLALSWASGSSVVDIPADKNGIRVTRVDAGVNDVSVALES